MPNPQLRTFVLPPDPVPIRDPRPGEYAGMTMPEIIELRTDQGIRVVNASGFWMQADYPEWEEIIIVTNPAYDNLTTEDDSVLVAERNGDYAGLTVPNIVHTDELVQVATDGGILVATDVS